MNEYLRLWLGREVEADDDFLADEVVGLAWILDVEVEAIDEEVSIEFDFISGLGNFHWDIDRLGDAVEVEVPSEEVGLALGAGLGFRYG